MTSAMCRRIAIELHLRQRSTLPGRGQFESNRASDLGYDTRSLRSALVMRRIDALNPFKGVQSLAWRQPCGDSRQLTRRSSRSMRAMLGIRPISFATIPS